MSATTTPREFKVDYMPGYTGHVPTKSVRFGGTAGQIKKEILADGARHEKLMARLANFKNEKDRLYASNF